MWTGEEEEGKGRQVRINIVMSMKWFDDDCVNSLVFEMVILSSPINPHQTVDGSEIIIIPSEAMSVLWVLVLSGEWVIYCRTKSSVLNES